MIIQRLFSEKKKSREELEKDYKDASKKVQDKAGKMAGLFGAGSMGAVGAIAGSNLGSEVADKTKKGKKLDKTIENARRKYVGDVSKAATKEKLKEIEKSSGKRLFDLEKKAAKRWKTGGKIGQVTGAVGMGALGYKMNDALMKKSIKRGDEKFLKTATDEQLESATKNINKNFGSKKAKKDDNSKK
jgi:hypothetical protein